VRVSTELRRRAKELRRSQTDAEEKLWMRLRGSQIPDAKFRRQHPIASLVADFCCPKRRLVVEVDGGQHADNVRDQKRTAYLTRLGFKVIRFWNHEVLNDTDAVVDKISDELQVPHPNPLPGKGEGTQTGCIPFSRKTRAGRRTTSESPSHGPR
jgi:very-short-patch-repair endonuclease